MSQRIAFKLVFVSLLCLYWRKTNAQVIISPFAGTNITSFYGSAPGVVAQFNTVQSINAGNAGNILIADMGNSAVRKFDATTGLVTKIAGTGITGFSGDGSAANSAQLNQPYGAVEDLSGNIFIADFGNNRIRKINTSGVISTFAGTGTYGSGGDGGPAASADIICQDVAVDRLGNIYIACIGSIRKVNTLGIISTVAGTGGTGYGGDGGPATSAIFNGAFFVTVDSVSNIYIADYYNNRVRKVNELGIISTIAGVGFAGYSGDGGPATAARINHPTAVFVDDTGNVFIADKDNNVIRRIDTFGIISTFSGTGTIGFNGDGGAASSAEFNIPIGITGDHQGNIFVNDQANTRIRKINTSAVINTVMGNGGYGGDGGLAINAQLQTPTGVFADRRGSVFIADTGNNTVRKVDASGIITTIAGSGFAGYAGDGGPSALSSLNKPIDVCVDTAGDIYISDFRNNVIRKINKATGIISTFAGTGAIGYTGDGGSALSATLNHPYGVTADTNGNVYFSDNGNNVIRKINSSTGIITTYAGNGTAGYSGDGGSAMAAKLNSPTYIAIDENGDLFISDKLNNVVRKITTATGIISTIAGNGLCSGPLGDGGPATSAQTCEPAGIATGNFPEIFIRTGARVRNVTTSAGTVTTTAGSAIGLSPDGVAPSLAALNGSAGICTDNNSLYIADAQNRSVRKIGSIVSISALTQKKSTNLTITPNPNNGLFTVTASITLEDAQNILTLYVVNVFGQTVYSTQLQSKNRNISIDVVIPAPLPPGLYVCRLVGLESSSSIPFVIESKN